MKHFALNIIMTSKSIKFVRSCKLITFLGAVVVAYSLMKDVVAIQSHKKYKKMEILDDLPLKNNMERYLISLEKIVSFGNNYNRYVDLNFAFGLFLIEVNLKTIYLMKGIKLPIKTKTRMEKILKTNDAIMKYFRQMYHDYVDETNSDSPGRYITQLFTEGEITWSNHLQRFRSELLNKTTFYSKRELKQIYSNWPQYLEKVYDFDSYYPSPIDSDNCISSLSQLPVNHKMKWVTCNVAHSCLKMVLNGTDYGYALTHRLLYFIMTRFSRGCTVMSATQDKNTIDKFCAKIYSETEYISQHNFEIVDLALEQIALCTLEGHMQFLRRSWIDDLLDFQNPIGCLGNSAENKDDQPAPGVYENDRPKWEMTHENQDIMGGICNSHTTGVAAGMLAAAIRYILEKYY